MKTIRLTEEDLKRIVEKVIQEQGILYGNPTDVVDYKLPELSSDVIILTKPKNFIDVSKSLKEIHKRVKFLETALSDLREPFSDTEDKKSSENRDAEMMKQIELLQSKIESGDEFMGM